MTDQPRAHAWAAVLYANEGGRRFVYRVLAADPAEAADTALHRHARRLEKGQISEPADRQPPTVMPLEPEPHAGIDIITARCREATTMEDLGFITGLIGMTVSQLERELHEAVRRVVWNETDPAPQFPIPVGYRLWRHSWDAVDTGEDPTRDMASPEGDRLRSLAAACDTIRSTVTTLLMAGDAVEYGPASSRSKEGTDR